MEKFKIKRKIIVEEEVTYNKYIAHRLTQLRTQRKMTQEDLAIKIGMSRMSLTNIEKGRQALTMKNLYLVCEVLQVKSSQILPF